MNKIIRHIHIAFGIILMVLCFMPPLFAHAYRVKYAKVLEYYKQNPADSLKYKAALYLIDNMDGHYSPEGEQIERFKNIVGSIGHSKGIRELNRAWHEAGKEGMVTLVPDSAVITNQMLISNINEAYCTWQSTPWRAEVDFDTFCKYILPYRCSTEHIGANWRKAMSDKYKHLIKGEKSIVRAFAVIKAAVYKDVVLSNAYCPYALDALTCYKIGRAECGGRCILLTDVLRSLGIPAAIDNTPMWADYSSKSHGWVAMIGKNGTTYTVYEDDFEAKSMNPIDASYFIPRYNVQPEDKCPYAVKQNKTPIKVYREEYSNTKNHVKFFRNQFLIDVSDKYGLSVSITLNVNTDREVYLCSYLSSHDWVPIASAMSSDGRVTFHNVGKGAVCTAYVYDKEKKVYVTHPFMVGEQGIVKFFNTDVANP